MRVNVPVPMLIALPRVTEPPVLLMVRLAFPVLILPESVSVPVPVKVTVPVPVEVPLNDQFPVKEITLVADAAVHVPAPLTSPLTVRVLLAAMEIVPVIVIPAQV